MGGGGVKIRDLFFLSFPHFKVTFFQREEEVGFGWSRREKTRFYLVSKRPAEAAAGAGLENVGDFEIQRTLGRKLHLRLCLSRYINVKNVLKF